MKDKALLTVGEMAKEMDVTVRTLQYYDKEGLLKPSAKSEGGRRLYTKKDMVKLHQILALKYLGFSLEDIRGRLFSLEDPREVASILEKQEESIKEQIENLKEALTATQTLRQEVLQIDSVDFAKYADIIALLKQKNENYWLIKLFDNELSDHIRDRFKDEPDEGITFFNNYTRIVDQTIVLLEQGEKPSGEKGIALAKEWWDMILEFTGGDMSILANLMKFNENKEGWDEEMAAKQQKIDEFIGPALDAYFRTQQISIPEMEGEA